MIRENRKKKAKKKKFHAFELILLTQKRKFKMKN
jgi:hypothetical protein